MKRELEIYDKTNDINMHIDFDDACEFIELWGVVSDEKPLVILERKRYEYRPYAFYPKKA